MAKKGRPSSYTDETADIICQRIADGESLRRICRDENMPDRETVRRWKRENETFRGQFAQARVEATDEFADRMLDYCYDLETAQTMVEVHGIKEASQNLRWLCGVMNPKQYSETHKQEHTGGGGTPLQIIVNRPGGQDG